MVERLIIHSQTDQGIERVRDVKENENGDRNGQFPLLTLVHQSKEADIEISVESGDLTHQQLYVVPLIQFQHVLVIDPSLDSTDNEYLKQYGVERVTCVNEM